MSGHVNVQICVQRVIETDEVQDRYGKITTPASRKVREERINIVGETESVAFTKAMNALKVLGSLEL